MKSNSTVDPHRQTIGIDVSADQLQVQLGQTGAGGRSRYGSDSCFSNTAEGYRQLWQWARQQSQKSAELWFIMEATGVYYESLAYFLHKHSAKVCVLVPHRAKHYAKSLPMKSKTDAIDAEILARYGLERQPRRWQPGAQRLRKIKLLLREREQLKDQRSQLKSRIHAARRAWQYPEAAIQRLNDHVKIINEYLADNQDQLDRLWSGEQQLAEATDRIAGVDGIGPQTVLKIVAETNGFALINNRNQLASYSGLDVVLDQSGARRGGTKISKQGNAHIRRALYMPALSAIQHNRALKAFYQRLVERHPDRKKMAVVAVMRKLLLLIYGLWKSGQEYDPQYHYQQITKPS